VLTSYLGAERNSVRPALDPCWPWLQSTALAAAAMAMKHRFLTAVGTAARRLHTGSVFRPGGLRGRAWLDQAVGLALGRRAFGEAFDSEFACYAGRLRSGAALGELLFAGTARGAWRAGPGGSCRHRRVELAAVVARCGSAGRTGARPPSTRTLPRRWLPEICGTLRLRRLRGPGTIGLARSATWNPGRRRLPGRRYRDAATEPTLLVDRDTLARSLVRNCRPSPSAAWARRPTRRIGAGRARSGPCSSWWDRADARAGDPMGANKRNAVNRELAASWTSRFNLFEDDPSCGPACRPDPTECSRRQRPHANGDYVTERARVRADPRTEKAAGRGVEGPRWAAVGSCLACDLVSRQHRAARAARVKRGLVPACAGLFAAPARLRSTWPRAGTGRRPDRRGPGLRGAWSKTREPEPGRPLEPRSPWPRDRPKRRSRAGSFRDGHWLPRRRAGLGRPTCHRWPRFGRPATGIAVPGESGPNGRAAERAGRLAG